VFHEKMVIYIPILTGDEYRDSTYGHPYPVGIREDAELMRLALTPSRLIALG
jgi:hypothetical protein